MEYVKTITLDVDPRGTVPCLYIKQNDSHSRFIKCRLQRGGVDYTPEPGTQILFRCEKPDGNAVVTDSESPDVEFGRYLIVVNSDGTVTVELVPQVCAVTGRCFCDICLMQSGKILSSTPFILIVVQAPNVASQIESEDDFRILGNAIARVDGLLDEALLVLRTITLSTNWNGDASPYTQAVTVTGYTPTQNTKVDLHAMPSVINAMREGKTEALVIVNNDGALTAYAFGNKPTVALTVQASFTEGRT